MPDENELETATNLAVTLAWAAGAVAAGYLLGVVLAWVLSRIGRRSGVLSDIAELTRMPVRAALMAFAASIAVRRTSDPAADSWRRWVDHTLLILLIAALTWLLTSLVRVAERRMIARYGGGDDEISDADRIWRRVRTQVTVLRRLAIAIVVILGGAAILMTFPSFSDIGTTVFASAGVLSVVAGLAAQTSLGAVFAGMQIAFSGAIRVGDVVQLENGQWWGRIEEITLSYVVVRLWDERRLVLPTHLLHHRAVRELDPQRHRDHGHRRVRCRLLRSVRRHARRVGPAAGRKRAVGRPRCGVLQVTDAVGGMVRVRIVVSAPNAGALFDLRCAVREGMVDWVQRTRVLPTQRIESAEPTSSPESPHATVTARRRASRQACSPAAPRPRTRARAFDEHARLRGRTRASPTDGPEQRGQRDAAVLRGQRAAGGEQRLGAAQRAGENERALQRADQRERHLAGRRLVQPARGEVGAAAVHPAR